MAGLNVAAALIYSDPTGTQQPCLCVDLCGCWARQEIKHETACLWLTCQRLSLSLYPLWCRRRGCVGWTGRGVKELLPPCQLAKNTHSPLYVFSNWNTLNQHDRTEMHHASNRAMKTFWLQRDLGYQTLSHTIRRTLRLCFSRKPFDDGRDESLTSKFGEDQGMLFIITGCMSASHT